MGNPYRHPIGGCPPELIGFSPSSLVARSKLFSEETRDRIRAAMAGADVSQRELARRLGVTEARVSQMLAGNMTLRTVDRIFAVCPTKEGDHVG